MACGDATAQAMMPSVNLIPDGQRSCPAHTHKNSGSPPKPGSANRLARCSYLGALRRNICAIPVLASKSYRCLRVCHDYITFAAPWIYIC